MKKSLELFDERIDDVGEDLVIGPDRAEQSHEDDALEAAQGMVRDDDYRAFSRYTRELGLVDRVAEAFLLDHPIDEREAVQAPQPVALVDLAEAAQAEGRI